MSVLSTATARIIKYELRDVMRSRWLIAYALFFGIATAVAVEMTTHLEGDEAHPVVAILDLRDGLVTRERIYIADPWEPITYRRPWAEPLTP